MWRISLCICIMHMWHTDRQMNNYSSNNNVSGIWRDGPMGKALTTHSEKPETDSTHKDLDAPVYTCKLSTCIWLQLFSKVAKECYPATRSKSKFADADTDRCQPLPGIVHLRHKAIWNLRLNESRDQLASLTLRLCSTNFIFCFGCILPSTQPRSKTLRVFQMMTIYSSLCISYTLLPDKRKKS